MSEKNIPKIPWWQPGMQLFLRLSSWIVFPVIAAVVLGKFLDRIFHSEPWLFLIAVIGAFIFSIIIIVRIGLKEMTASEKAEKPITK